MTCVHGIHYATGKPVAVTIDGGRIGAIDPLTGADLAAAAGLPFVGPGLVDLQVNGYAGHDFNRAPPDPAAVGEAARLLWREGVTSFYPTVITASVDAITASLTTIAAACDADGLAAAAVAGVHLEGPFISPDDGARGAHPLAHVRPPDWDLLRRWQDAAGGRIRILTLSPECPDAPAFVERCTTAGIIVSVGHTAASPQQVADAVRAGARLVTHFGNGAHLSLPRHPNYLWEQLAQDDLWACVIADGFHLPDQVLKVVLKVKGDRAVLVSDAVALAGMPPGAYDAAVGGRVVLTAAGRLHLASDERLLAGSARMQPHGIAHLVDRGLATLADAWDMASTRPARLMALPQAPGLAAGAPADLVLFRQQAAGVRVEKTFKGGRCVFAVTYPEATDIPPTAVANTP